MTAHRKLVDHNSKRDGNDILSGDDLLTELLDLDNLDIDDKSDDDDCIHPSFDNAEHLRHLLTDSGPDDSDEDPTFEPGLGEDDDEPTSQRKRKKTTTPPPKTNHPPKKCNKGPDWKESNMFQPEPIVLSQPAYKPHCVETWDDKFIAQYFDDDFLQMMMDKTNQTFVYLVGKSLQLTLAELKMWIGISCIMSTLQYPKIRMYWERNYRVPIISDAMSQDRFFLIRKSIKVVFDNEISEEERARDQIWKIQPLDNHVLQGCMEQACDQEVCIDAQAPGPSSDPSTSPCASSSFACH